MHSNEGDVIKMHPNRVTIVLMSYTLSKLYVDIKFDIFNLKGGVITVNEKGYLVSMRHLG